MRIIISTAWQILNSTKQGSNPKKEKKEEQGNP
jgi:hypothetical protein